MTQEEIQAIGRLLDTWYSPDHTYYQILLFDKPFYPSITRIFYNEGAAKTAVTKAISGLMHNYDYWSQYSHRKPNPKQVQADFDLVKEIIGKWSYGLVSLNNVEISKRAPLITKEFIKNNIIKIIKIEYKGN
jgi:hypothetical protein